MALAEMFYKSVSLEDCVKGEACKYIIKIKKTVHNRYTCVSISMHTY